MPAPCDWRVSWRYHVIVDSRWSLAFDLLTAKALVWIAARGGPAELTPEAHRFFYDRYVRLAEHYRAKGEFNKAARYRTKAASHYLGDDGPPYAAAMALGRPRRLIQTDAVSRGRFDGPNDAA